MKYWLVVFGLFIVLSVFFGLNVAWSLVVPVAKIMACVFVVFLGLAYVEARL